MFRNPETQGRKAASGFSMRLQALFLVLPLAGCAPQMRSPGGGEGAKKFQEAETAFEQEKYSEARVAYRALAENQAASRRAVAI